MVFSLFRSKQRGKQLEQERAQAVVSFVSQALGVQQALFLHDDGTMPAKAFDRWSIGYVAGSADAVLQKNGFQTDVEEIEIILNVFREVFGESRGPELFVDFMHLQDQGNHVVDAGMVAGGHDVYAWMANRDTVPTGWIAYMHSLDDA